MVTVIDSDASGIELICNNNPLEKELESYVKLYRSVLIQAIRDAVESELEMRTSYNFIMRPEGDVLCEIIGVSTTKTRSFFEKLKEDEYFRDEVKARMMHRS